MSDVANKVVRVGGIDKDCPSGVELIVSVEGVETILGCDGTIAVFTETAFFCKEGLEDSSSPGVVVKRLRAITFADEDVAISVADTA